jgi:hypothetical protein
LYAVRCTSSAVVVTWAPMATGEQLASHFSNQAGQLGQLIASHKQLDVQLKSADDAIGKELAEAKRELAAVYLPALTDEAFLRAARLTGFQGFERRDPRAALAHERKVLGATLARIEGDNRYARRDVLVGPSGTLQQEIDATRVTLEPLETECARFENQETFLELVAIGYDTPAFSEHWWEASYWRHWAAGDRICKALDLNDFGDDVLPAYKKYAEPRDVLREDVKRLTKEIDAVHELVREHDRVADRVANLDAIYLAEAQDFLGEHLAHADVALLEQWVANEADILRPVQLGLRRLSGVLAKRRFVGEIGGQGVPQIVKQLEERKAKALQKAQKFSRWKNLHQQFPNSMMQDDFSTKAQALEAQRDKLGRRVDTLVTTRNYAGFDLRQDQEMWWLYYFNAPPPRFAPGLYSYYERRPGITVLVDDSIDLGPSPSEAVATAVLAGELERGGAYLS